jgi:hypothetical protein
MHDPYVYKTHGIATNNSYNFSTAPDGERFIKKKEKKSVQNVWRLFVFEASADPSLNQLSNPIVPYFDLTGFSSIN